MHQRSRVANNAIEKTFKHVINDYEELKEFVLFFFFRTFLKPGVVTYQLFLLYNIELCTSNYKKQNHDFYTKLLNLIIRKKTKIIKNFEFGQKYKHIIRFKIKKRTTTHF